MKLSIKISIATFVITLLISMVSGYMLYRYFSGIMLSSLNEDDRIKLNAVVDDVNSIMIETNKFGQYIAINQTIQNYLISDQYDSVFYLFQERQRVRDNLNEFVFLSEYIHSVALVKNSQDIVWTYLPFEDEFSIKDRERWYLSFLEASQTEDENSFLVSQPFEYSDSRRDIMMVSLAMPCRSIEYANTRIGTIVINIEWSTIESIIRSHEQDFDALAYVSSNQIVRFNTNLLVDHTTFDEIAKSADGSGNLGPITYHESDTLLNGQVIAIQNYSRLIKSIQPQTMILLLMLFCGVVLIIGVLIPVLLKMTRPAKTLALAMKTVGKGELDTQVDIQTNDEFSDLGDGFNKMVKQIDQYVKASILNEKVKHQMEYELLLAQIDPHFIYNTLNTIIHLARKESCEDIITLTSSFIDLLHDGIKLSENKIFSTIDQEIRMIKNYMSIQNYRYKDLFQFEVDYSESILQRSIPYFIIQPLVENALFHGIAPKKKRGRIWLSLKRIACDKHSCIQITVEDEGVGIEMAQVQKILSGELVDDQTNSHVGLHNVLNRLELLFGCDYTFEIMPRPGGGTTVRINIPETVDFHNEQIDFEASS